MAEIVCNPKALEALNSSVSTLSGNVSTLSSNLSSLTTTVNGKVNTSAIANNLTTTSSGYVLDARQGKELNDKTVQHVLYSTQANKTANLFGLDSNSTYLIFCTSNASKGVWFIQTGLSSGTVTKVVSSTGLTVQMASSSSLILQYTNSTSYSLGLGVVKLGTC